MCLAGYYWEQASTAPVVWPVGTYAPTTGYQAAYSTVVGVKACLACPSGQTCATAGTVTTTTWGTGKYSYPGTTNCLTCKAGHYWPDASTSSTQHDNTYICPAGYLWPEGTPADPTTSGNTYKCAMGYYWLQGATAATACLAGTYNDVLGGTSVSSCRQTPLAIILALLLQHKEHNDLLDTIVLLDQQVVKQCHVLQEQWGQQLVLELLVINRLVLLDIFEDKERQ